MKNVSILILLFAVMLAGHSCGRRTLDEESKSIAEDKNDEKFDTKAGESEAQFVVDEISSAYAEISLAELAVKQSRDNEVKNVASLIKSEHATLLKDLQRYASSKAISIPTEATDEAQLKVNELAKAKNFDKTWCAEVRRMHRQTIDEFELASSAVSDTALRKWVNKTLPSLRAHHDKIMACDERLK